MIRERIKNKIEKESGQSMVELAVSVVVLLILLAGVVDFGRLAFYYLALKDAAQEGASYASIFPNDNFEIIERVKAGVVDENQIQVILRFRTMTPGDYFYECSYNIPEVDDECTQYVDTRGDNDVELNNIVEITVRDPAFPLTMPFFGGQEINLETTISDVIVRVPMPPTPTPNP